MAQVLGQAASGDATAAQHRDLAGIGLDLAQLVGDQHHGDPPRVRHLAHQTEDLVRLSRCQHAGRLIEDEEAMAEEELLEDLQLLLLARRKTAHGAVEIEPERHGLQEPLEAGELLLPVDDGGQGILAQHQVLGHRHARHQGEVLIDHAEAQVMGLARVGDVPNLARDPDLSRVRVIVAHQALDERALARAVLAEEGVEGPGIEADRDLVEREQGAEPLGHPTDRQVRRPVLRAGLRGRHLLIDSSLGAPANRCLVDEL